MTIKSCDNFIIVALDFIIVLNYVCLEFLAELLNGFILIILTLFQIFDSSLNSSKIWHIVESLVDFVHLGTEFLQVFINVLEETFHFVKFEAIEVKDCVYVLGRFNFDALYLGCWHFILLVYYFLKFKLFI